MAAVSIILAVLLWIIGGLVGLLLLLAAAILLLPIDFRTRLDGRLREAEESEWGVSGYARWATRVRWGWWVLRLEARGEALQVENVSFRIGGYRLRGRRKTERSERQEAGSEQPDRAKKKKRRRSLHDVISYVREGLRLAQRLIASLRLRLTGDLVVGFSDPAVTGMLLGVLAVAGTPGQLRVQPDWLDPGINGWAEVEGRIYGFEVAAALWTAYWRSPKGERVRQRIRGLFKRTKRIVGGRTA